MELKSVRVRRFEDGMNGTIDTKVTLSRKSNLNNKYEVIWEANGLTKEVYEYDLNSDINQKKKLFFESNINNYQSIVNGEIVKGFNSNRDNGDVFINDVILQKSRIYKTKHEIIQDPYTDIPPIIRNYSNDPYYLNNGSQVYINWYIDNQLIGGRQWSDESGSELLIASGSIDNIRESIIKKVKIINNPNIYYLNENMEFSKVEEQYSWIGTILDIDILSTVINIWKKDIIEYDLSQCNPNNEFCNIIEYIDPLNKSQVLNIDREPEKKMIKKKLIVSYPSDIKFKAKDDIISLIITIDGIYDTEFDESLIDPEYYEGDFIGLEEIYQGPDPNALDDSLDPDNSKGSDEEVEFEVPSSGKISDVQKSFIKNAIKSTGPGGPGKCARYTFNHANNYCLQILGKSPVGSRNAAGGNANQGSYHKNLERLGYKRYDQGTVSKDKIIADLKKSNWDIGDVVVYWGINSNLGNDSCVRYGHTQIYTAGKHNNSNYYWSSDEPNNFKSGFVYGRKPVVSWRYMIFKAPKPKGAVT